VAGDEDIVDEEDIVDDSGEWDVDGMVNTGGSNKEEAVVNLVQNEQGVTEEEIAEPEWITNPQ
jgi:hypothetical protein